jgi:hypothetical protein
VTSSKTRRTGKTGFATENGSSAEVVDKLALLVYFYGCGFGKVVSSGAWWVCVEFRLEPKILILHGWCL